MLVPRRESLLFAGLLMASLFGCGGPAAPERKFAEVTGKVSYRGAPLKMGQVMFQPPTGALASGDIKADGTYSLQGVIGPNTVTIISRDPEQPITPENRKTISEPKSHIPASYGTPASGLSFEVKAGKNTKDFDLK